MITEDVNVRRVFEFGCGNGKNLMLIKEKKPDMQVGGMDICDKAIHRAKVRGLENVVKVGDETSLPYIPRCYYSLAFTVSVLNHLPEDISEIIINELKEIANYKILLVESETEPNERYFSHDYSKWGFEKTSFKFKSVIDTATYRIWSWEA